MKLFILLSLLSLSAYSKTYLGKQRTALLDICSKFVDDYKVVEKTFTAKDFTTGSCETSEAVPKAAKACNEAGASVCRTEDETLGRFKHSHYYCVANVHAEFRVKKTLKEIRQEVCEKLKSCSEVLTNKHDAHYMADFIPDLECDDLP